MQYLDTNNIDLLCDKLVNISSVFYFLYFPYSLAFIYSKE